MRTWKVVEPLQEEIIEILRSEDHQAWEGDMQTDLSIDASYDNPNTFSPSSIEFYRERRRLLFPTESNSIGETYLIDEQAKVGSSTQENQEERYVFHGNPEAHRPITRAKNKLQIRFN